MAGDKLFDMRLAVREPDQAPTEAESKAKVITAVSGRRLNWWGGESYVVADVESAEGKWRVAVSATAWSLYETIRKSPEDATAGIEEWAREFRTSKTAIRRALGELEEHGFITAYVEEES
jgi:hypothetical protein